MKCYTKILATLLLAAGFSTKAAAQDCDLPISVVLYPQTEALTEAAEAALENQLNRIATSTGLNASLPFNHFILTARIDVLDKTVVAGAPTRITQDMGFTFYIADVNTKTKFASAYVEVSGVGTNDTKCQMYAIRQLKGSNPKIAKLLETGREKILTYFDNNYEQILQEAERKAALQRYDEAIAMAVSIPVCSKGGKAATLAGLRFYAKYRDKYNQTLLNEAKAIWAAGQGQEEARKAGKILAQIDPEAACYDDAERLANEIKKQVRSDLDFEMRQKYNDSVKLENQRIEAMRAVGVAYGKGQQPQTTNITWLN